MQNKRILVFRTGHLGDTLVALPSFWAIRKSLPGAKITLLSNTNPKNPQYILAQSVLPEKELFDNWLNYPTGLSKYQTLQMFKSLFREIRRSKFDSLFYLMNRSRTLKQIKRDEIFFRLAGIKKIYGINHLKDNILNFQEERPLPVVNSEMDFLLQALVSDNFPILDKSELKPDLLLAAEEKEFAKNWLTENVCGNYKEKKIVGVAPASKWESKIWSEERFYTVVGHLIEKRNIYPVVFGGPEDSSKGDRLIKKWRTGANAAGDLNIRQAAAALEECCLYLGNDTGTMHLAASVGTICVGIFAAIDYEGRWIPFGDNNKIFRKKVECEGCHTPVCFNKHKCLRLVTVDEILAACLEILDNV